MVYAFADAAFSEALYAIFSAMPEMIFFFDAFAFLIR